MRLRDAGLRGDQVAFLDAVLPGGEVLHDDSWGLLDTRVLHVRCGAAEYTVKACGPENTHFPREFDAHHGWTDVLVRQGDTSRLVAADADARVIVLDRLPGHLALGAPEESVPDVHRQAGAVLRRFHAQASRADDVLDAAEHAKALRSLDAPHRIAPEDDERARHVLERYRPRSVVVVPTHGDWQPRNWIVDGDRVHVIDFGRFALRPAANDLTRLAVLHWEDDPSLEEAFFAGYGDDPREAESWRWIQLREAIGTAVWAYAVGDERFEAQGHRMLRNALAAF